MLIVRVSRQRMRHVPAPSLNSLMEENMIYRRHEALVHFDWLFRIPYPPRVWYTIQF